MTFIFNPMHYEMRKEYDSHKPKIVKDIVELDDEGRWTSYAQRKQLGIGSTERRDKDMARTRAVKDVDEPKNAGE